MTKETLQISTYLPYRMAIVSRKLSLALEKTYGEQFALSRSEWRTLALLQERKVATGAQLAALSGMDAVAIHRAVKALDRKHLLQRQAHTADARATSLSLTVQGKKIFRDIAPQALLLEKALLSKLTPSQANHLVKAMEILAAADL